MTNTSGLGALTVGNGIPVVQNQAPALAEAQFALTGRVAAGAYEYSLRRPADGSWYLQSARAGVPLTPLVPATPRTPGLPLTPLVPATPGNPNPPATPDTPYRVEVPLDRTTNVSAEAIPNTEPNNNEANANDLIQDKAASRSNCFETIHQMRKRCVISFALRQ